MVGNLMLSDIKGEIRSDVQVWEGLHHHSQKERIYKGINDKCQSNMLDLILRKAIFQYFPTNYTQSQKREQKIEAKETH